MSVKLVFSKEERKALRYCTYCPRLCRFTCPVAHGEARETTTPWGKMRLLHLIEQGTLEPTAAVLETLHHCISCGRCQSICLHDIPVAEILAKGRAQLVGNGLGVPEAFAVPVGGCQVEVPLPTVTGVSDEAPVFLPSCSHLADEESSARLADALQATVAAGYPLGLPTVRRYQGCGFHEWEAGLSGTAERSWLDFVDQAGPDRRVVTDCAPGLWLARQREPHESTGPVHLVEWLASHLDVLPEGHIGQEVAVHDSCFVSRRLGLGRMTRDVVRHLTGRKPKDLFEANDEARCCGAEGQWATARPDAQKRAADTVIGDILDAGAGVVVTASPTCRGSLSDGLRKQGASVQVLDLIDLLAKLPPADK